MDKKEVKPLAIEKCRSVNEDGTVCGKTAPYHNGKTFFCSDCYKIYEAPKRKWTI